MANTLKDKINDAIYGAFTESGSFKEHVDYEDVTKAVCDVLTEHLEDLIRYDLNY